VLEEEDLEPPMGDEEVNGIGGVKEQSAAGEDLHLTNGFAGGIARAAHSAAASNGAMGGDIVAEIAQQTTDEDLSKGKPIPREERTTTPYMTKYERARILGTRALQIRYFLSFRQSY
jgi:hypothetical protein